MLVAVRVVFEVIEKRLSAQLGNSCDYRCPLTLESRRLIVLLSVLWSQLAKIAGASYVGVSGSLVNRGAHLNGRAR